MSRITCLNLPIASKWLYVGTDKGNVHVVNIDSFALSGYIINWNKAIEVYVNESFHFSLRFYAVRSFREITKTNLRAFVLSVPLFHSGTLLGQLGTVATLG